MCFFSKNYYSLIKYPRFTAIALDRCATGVLRTLGCAKISSATLGVSTLDNHGSIICYILDDPNLT